MDEQNVRPCNVILFSLKKEENSNIRYKMDEPRMYYA